MKINTVKALRFSLTALSVASATGIVVVLAYLFPALIRFAVMAGLLGILTSATAHVLAWVAKNHDLFATAAIFTIAGIFSAIAVGVFSWL